MVIDKKDAEGRIIAYAEYRMVNEKGIDDERGEYIWINDVWVHKDYRTRNVFNTILQGFIARQAESYPWAKFIYWQREKHGERMSTYNRAKILRRTKNGEGQERRTAIDNTYTFAGAGAHTGPGPI
jgi:ribosome-binding factor A